MLCSPLSHNYKQNKDMKTVINSGCFSGDTSSYLTSFPPPLRPPWLLKELKFMQ